MVKYRGLKRSSKEHLNKKKTLTGTLKLKIALIINSIININSVNKISFLCEAMAAKRQSAFLWGLLQFLYSKKSKSNCS